MSHAESNDENQSSSSAVLSEMSRSEPPLMIAALNALKDSQGLTKYTLSLMHHCTMERLYLTKKTHATSLVEKMSIKDLMAEDEKGDTQLMRMLSGKMEFLRNKPYLRPIVERMKTIPGALQKQNKEGKDALLLAATNLRQMPYVFSYLVGEMLLEEIDVNKVYDNFDNTLLHLIAKLGDRHQAMMVELVTLLKMDVHYTPNVSRRNCFDETALHLAVKLHHAGSNNFETIRMTDLLLACGVDRKARIKPNDDTALHMAVSLHCDPKLVQVLLSSADSTIVNMKNNMGNTPLHLAAQVSEIIDIEKQVKVCKLLIKAGAETNVVNEKGQNPFDLVSSERKEILKKILYKDND